MKQLERLADSLQSLAYSLHQGHDDAPMRRLPERYRPLLRRLQKVAVDPVIHQNMDADCLESNGEEALFSGIVTQVLGEVSPWFGLPVGSRLWIKVKDNGQGPNALLDQYHPAIISNPGGMVPCSAIGLNSILWNIIGSYEEVANSSDNIKVR